MIEIILMAVGLYLALGLVCAVLLHATGLRRIDSGVNDAGWLFRLLITPGLVALWPVLLLAWRRAVRGEDTAGRADRPISPKGLRSVHRILATALLILLPLAVVAGLLARPDVSMARTSVRSQPSVPEALPQVLMEEVGLVGEAEAAWRLLTDDAGRMQVELSLDRDAALPSLVLFWVARGASSSSDGSLKEGLPAGSVSLGSVWGPGLFRFPVEVPGGGTFLVYSLAHGERVATLRGGQN